MGQHDSFQVPYVGLKKEFDQRQAELLAAFSKVAANASYILREEVGLFEASISKMLGVRHVIGVNSGTDALFLALKALNIGSGDEVITVAHTFVATIAAIVHCGAKPVLVDIADDFNLAVATLEQAITVSTKAIIPVHMNGRCCDMEAILSIANKYGLHVVEDAAQSMGSHIDGTYAGTFGVINAFSLHPMKNLHCYGDGGVVTTNDDRLAKQLRLLRNHGQNPNKELVAFGFNSRLDNLQAAFLNINLKYFDGDIARRRQIALRYHAGLKDCAGLKLPNPPQQSSYFDVFSSYPIRCAERNRLLRHLQQKGIECFIHWETPLHRNEYLKLGHFSLPVTEQIVSEVLSLPIHPFLEDEQCDYVIDAVKEFFNGC
ncbi:MAG: DegT/DnrJ/EryC1/StrS family aminotransferase [Methylobacter sp.]|nr:DegT/DnrJ/EryC1/StrS family aminotransferase [Methylobacter sp.]